MSSVTINRRPFLQALAMLSKVVPARTTLPILTGVLISGDGSRITLTASDIESTMEISFPATGLNGAITLPYKLLVEQVRSISAPTVTLTLGESPSLKGGGASFSVRPMSGEFPAYPSDVIAHTETMDTAKARSILGLYSLAATDRTRGAVCGISMECHTMGIYAVATNGARAGRFLLPHEGNTMTQTDSSPICNAVIPANVAANAAKYLTGQGEVKIIFYQEKRVGFEFASTGIDTTQDNSDPDAAGGADVICRYSSRVIEAEYPNTRRIFRMESPLYVTVPKDDFVSALNRARIYAADDASRVYLKREGDGILITAISPSYGTFTELVPGEFSCDLPLSIMTSSLILSVASFMGSGIRIGYESSERGLTMESTIDSGGFLGMIAAMKGASNA